jgi:hypothetical protein
MYTFGARYALPPVRGLWGDVGSLSVLDPPLSRCDMRARAMASAYRNHGFQEGPHVNGSSRCERPNMHILDSLITD